MLYELNRKFREHLDRRKFFSPDDGILVGVSGGLDSLVLLHLLHFDPFFSDLHIVVGHFDHRMRNESHRDALWVKGLAKSWGVTCQVGRASRRLYSENDARIARYSFFENTKISLGLKSVLTAHHADDQAETILFRILRGTGLLGLKGIPESRSPGIIRPLLPFHRDELEDYAEKVGIHPLEDPSNVDSGFARNALRNDILPQIEENVARGARSALVRLGQIAREDQKAWDSVLQKIYDDLILHRDSDRIVLDRDAFLGYNDGVCAIMLRDLCNRFGYNLTDSATRSALNFSRNSQSGNSIQLGRAIWLHRSFEKLSLDKTECNRNRDGFEIEMPGVGMADLKLGNKEWIACWSTEVVFEDPWCEVFALENLVFPLCVRSWNPGDRITYSYGSKKLKKVFTEKKMSIQNRIETPVIVDAKGRTLWIPGVSRTSLFVAGKDAGKFSMSVSNPAQY